MSAKVVIFICAQALLAQSIASQYLPSAAPWVPPCTAPIVEEWTAFRPAASNGGGFSVTSVSPMAVTGITMTSENAYEGPLSVTGAVPFLSAVALEGALPTAGSGAIKYGCGNGNVAMVSEDINAHTSPNGYGPMGYEGYGYNRPCGCGNYY